MIDSSDPPMHASMNSSIVARSSSPATRTSRPSSPDDTTIDTPLTGAGLPVSASERTSRTAPRSSFRCSTGDAFGTAKGMTAATPGGREANGASPLKRRPSTMPTVGRGRFSAASRACPGRRALEAADDSSQALRVLHPQHLCRVAEI
jgi:hypothetical protein